MKIRRETSRAFSAFVSIAFLILLGAVIVVSLPSREKPLLQTENLCSTELPPVVIPGVTYYRVTGITVTGTIMAVALQSEMGKSLVIVSKNKVRVEKGDVLMIDDAFLSYEKNSVWSIEMYCPHNGSAFPEDTPSRPQPKTTTHHNEPDLPVS